LRRQEPPYERQEQALPRYSFVVLTNPVDGQEDEFNRWYDEVHLHNFLRFVEGAVSVQRFHYVDPLSDAPPWRYLAIYEWDAESPEAARAALSRARDAGRLPIADALDVQTAQHWIFEPLAPALRAS
jgi:hypothetical protein